MSLFKTNLPQLNISLGNTTLHDSNNKKGKVKNLFFQRKKYRLIYVQWFFIYFLVYGKHGLFLPANIFRLEDKDVVEP